MLVLVYGIVPQPVGLQIVIPIPLLFVQGQPGTATPEMTVVGSGIVSVRDAGGSAVSLELVGSVEIEVLP